MAEEANQRGSISYKAKKLNRFLLEATEGHRTNITYISLVLKNFTKRYWYCFLHRVFVVSRKFRQSNSHQMNPSISRISAQFFTSREHTLIALTLSIVLGKHLKRKWAKLYHPFRWPNRNKAGNPSSKNSMQRIVRYSTWRWKLRTWMALLSPQGLGRHRRTGAVTTYQIIRFCGPTRACRR